LLASAACLIDLCLKGESRQNQQKGEGIERSFHLGYNFDTDVIT